MIAVQGEHKCCRDSGCLNVEMLCICHLTVGFLCADIEMMH